MRSLFAFFLLVVFAAPAAARDAKGEEFFEKQIRPLFARHCLKCHGDKKPEAGLRLTSRKAALAGGDSGPAVVAGQPDSSLIVQAVRYLDTTRMPPDGKLPKRDVDLMAQWVKMGAPWPEGENKPAANEKAFVITDQQRKFWSFQPVGSFRPPMVRNGDRVRNGIDNFILARLEAKKLSPAPLADRRTLVRRATFDLTGLPPTPDEVEAFLNDKSPDAYERLVDRLLASPAYGERWGRHWLDLVRYADSFDARGLGGETDCADAFRYRDWVVKAMNADLGYDRFLTDQIAGDLVPGDGPGGFNRDGVIATGMLAIGNWGGGDADKEKLLTDIADDQVDVVSRTFLGLTVSCARCHDHKFDPISAKDYYGLAGIFFSSHILPNVGPKTNGPPMMRIPLAPPGELARRAGHGDEVKALAMRLDSARRRATTEHVRRMLPQTSRYLLAAYDVLYAAKKADDVAKRDGLHPPTLSNWLRALRQTDLLPLAKTLPDAGGRKGVFAYRNDADCPNALVNTTNEAQKISTLTLPPRCVALHPGKASGAVASWTSPVTTTVRISGKVSDADATCGDGIEWRIVSSGQGELVRGEIANGGKKAFRDSMLGDVRVGAGERIDLVILPRGGYECDTTTVELTIRRADGKGEWDLTKDVIGDPARKKPSAWSFADTKTLKPWTGVDLAAWRAVAAKVSQGKANRDALEKASGAVARRFRTIDPDNPFWLTQPEDEAQLLPRHRESLAKLRAELEAKKKETFAPLEYANGTLDGGVPGSPHAGTHDVRVHLRGRYDRLGDLAPRRFPEILAGPKQTPITKGSGRMDLAKWLTSEKNPLTARVMVNRLWQHHFGRGLVNTPSNFGFQGEKPSHPELLDWLASEFVRSGWSMKAMHRLMMLSSTYRQDSAGDEAATKGDPDNLLLARMPRRRLEAEAIRDGLLFVAGNLDRTTGGVAVRDVNVPRRTLYLMTVRSDRTGFGPLFDVADSTAPVDKRTVSTVAPQALFLLNNPFSRKQAESLTKRVMEASKQDKGRVEFAYRLLYGRPPLSEEVTLGVAYVKRAGGGEAAWRDYCQVLLCANEFAYVE